ncbi:MAG: hypothetical protein K2L85_00075, partial [Paramuribaculum sp.]|nr:hypothetical protein [Paramuribaculum sp.]
PLPLVKTPHKILSINPTTKFKQFLRECLNLNRVNSNTNERQKLQNNPEVFFGEFRQVSAVA